MHTRSIVLIVDDTPAGRETLEALLFAEGYHLEFASDGPEALDKANQLMPDLILLDVMMPAMDGFEVCQQLRSNPLLSEVPVIMVTALDDQESRVRGIEAGADDFVSKPFNRTELRARVRTTVQLNRYRRLLTERARFEWVVEQAEDGYLIVSDQDMIRYANPQARLYLNLPARNSTVSDSDLAEAVNEPFLAIARKQYQCEPEHAWTTWAQEQSKQDGIVADDEGKECTLRYLVRPETATSHALWLHVDSIDMPDGTRETRLIRLRDVTEKMSRQRQTWTFHALISHKFSTPLTGLINSLHLLSYEAMDMAPAEVKEFSDIALQSSQRLHKQLREIRNYIVTPDIARPGDECSVVCIEHMLATIMEETGLDTITLCGHEHLDDTYFVISKQAVELIIRELLENARKFHPQHSPTVEIELTQVSDEEVKITVCDDGVTLSPEQLARAWIPYYQAEKGFSGEVPGMGLGLAMIAALLWNIGGRYRITNREPEPGIVVELVIPLAVDKTWDSVG